MSFDPEAAIASYLRAHAAECRVLDCVPDHSPWLALLIPAVTLIALLLVVVTGLSARCRDLAARITALPWLQEALYGASLGAVISLSRAAASYWLEHVLGIPSGPRVQVRDAAGNLITLGGEPSVAKLLTDAAQEMLVFMLAAAVLLPFVLAILRRFPRRYWAIPAVGAVLWLGSAMAEHPFRTDRPLPPGALYQDLADMAEASGQSVQRVRVGEQVMFKGGFFHGQVVWSGGKPTAVISERLFNALPGRPEATYRPVTASEVRALAGHELAHMQLGHLYYMPVVFAGLAILLAWAASVAARRAIDGRNRRWRLEGLADPAASPMLVACFFLAFLLFVPIRNLLMLAAESEADRVGLSISRDPDGIAAMAMREARGRPMRRSVGEHLLFFDHPSPEARIRRAMEWKAANRPAQWRASGLSGPLRVDDLPRREPVSGSFEPEPEQPPSD